ncbi:MAG: 50S ribosomal protein L9 [Planctomycetota bacterium]
MPRRRHTVPVLLLADREHLGHVGDVVEVRPGYARNFLFPTGTACPVSSDALRRVERVKEQADAQRRHHAARLADLATSLEGLSLTLEERASEEGHLFGSVSAATIVEALAARGLTVSDKQVVLDHAIKELGIYNVPIRLGKESTAEVRVWVVEPGD